jgi:hypothetical protein
LRYLGGGVGGKQSFNRGSFSAQASSAKFVSPEPAHRRVYGRFVVIRL